MRIKGDWAETTFRSTASEAKVRGSVTFAGEQRARQGKGLDPLVDPSKYDVVRISNNLLVPKGDQFVLEFGVAMPVESDPDTTGSMGQNVELVFGALPKVQKLLVQGNGAVLRRYHTQIATGVIQDQVDKFPYQRSQFEPDNEVERQMGLLVPEKGGGDPEEDYQIGLFAAAYLTKASITAYGLRGYYFPLGDEIGRDRLDREVLQQVFGPSVFEKAFGPKAPKDLPSTKEVAEQLLKYWHPFFLQVGASSHTTKWWREVLGKDRVIILPRTEDVAEVQATIIGLTEGTLDLQSVPDFLAQVRLSRERAAAVAEAVRGIPIGLQKTLPNFDRIPMAGAIFANRDDIWPIGAKEAKKPGSGKTGKPPAKSGKKSDWKI
jgi:hypothetical protein